MEKEYQYNEVLSFAEGYYDGRARGHRSNMHDDDILRIAYDKGYDAGVYDYIAFDEGKE